MKPLISVSDLLIISLTIVTVIIVLTKNHGDEGFDLYGSSGADTLTGDPGDNLIWGGAGADIIDGGDGLDTLDYGGSDAGVRVNLAENTAAGGHAEGDSITNFEHIQGSAFDDILTGDSGINILIGSAGDDTVDGAGANDSLRGGDGADFLSGGMGADRLKGGKDNDTFIFLAGDDSTDIIADFTNGEDLIDLADFSGVSFNDLVISADSGNCIIDLTGHDGGRIVLRKFNVSDLDASDFLFAR